MYFLWPSVPSEMTAVFCLLLGLVSTVLTSVSERDFIEGRRRALGRFINLVACHPFFSEDELVKTFLTFSGSVCSFFSFKIHFWLGLNSIPLVLMFDSCTMCIIIMMNDSQTLPVSAALCPFPFTDSFDSPVTLLPAGCPEQTAWHLQENRRWVHDQQNCNPG